MKWQKLVNATILGGFLLGVALVLPASAQTLLQDEVPGSYLVFPIFDISGNAVTQIRICDKSNGAKGPTTTWVRLNFICPGSRQDPFCDEYDTDFPLTSHQCKIIDVGDQRPPCNQGFVVAFAENATFDPWAYDHLIGSYNITTGTGTSVASEASKAIAIQSPQPFKALLGRPGSLGSLELSFCGVTQGCDYVSLPAILHSDFRATTATADTTLTLLTLNINSGADNNTTAVKLA